MRTCRRTVVLGATLSCLFLMRDDAVAKVESYQIHGQTYTYDTMNPQQVRMARERINAARSADQARARASAESSANPLVKIFGSKAQTEAAQAEAELKRTLSTNGLGINAIDGALPRGSKNILWDGSGKVSSVPDSRTLGPPRGTPLVTRGAGQGAGQALAGAEAGVKVTASRTPEPLRTGGGDSHIAALSAEWGSVAAPTLQMEPTSTGSIGGAPAHGSGGDDLADSGYIRTKGDADGQLTPNREQNAAGKLPAASWRQSICRGVLFGRC
jgi:hypothetical protein